jgi:hypothetical protein
VFNWIITFYNQLNVLIFSFLSPLLSGLLSVHASFSLLCFVNLSLCLTD